MVSSGPTAVRSACVLLLMSGAAAGLTWQRASAQDASAWEQDTHSAVRLVAGVGSGAGASTVRAGLEINLNDGWKTYWRYPGDSGVPPVFDFVGSTNVKSVEVRYPAPQRFDDGAGGTAIGYKGRVLWPLHVVRERANQPAALRISLQYAVCEKLCVPATAQLSLSLAGKSGPHDAAIAAAEERVPAKSRVGAPGSPSIRAVERQGLDGAARVVVDVVADAPATLLAEGPTSQWALPLPQPVSGAPTGVQRFAFKLEGAPPGVPLSGADLRLTAIAGARAVEVDFRLD